MIALGVILARAGSRGLPNKCLRDLLGKPVIQYTFEHARASRKLTHLVVSTDSKPIQALATQFDLETIPRPAALATDDAAVDDAARHAVTAFEMHHDLRVDCVALLYGNIPVRAGGLIDRAIDLLVRRQADSVRSVAPVSKHHPDWLHELRDDRLTQFRENGIYRRQDLHPLYYHDGAVAVVSRDALFAAAENPENRQAFWGQNKRALVQKPEDAVDIDGPIDLLLAQAVLLHQGAHHHAHA